MNRLLKQSLALAAVLTVGAWAGALVLQVANPESSPEAKSMHAALIADTTACMEPAKSTITASYIQLTQKGLQRTELQVMPMKVAGKFAVVGAVPAGSVIEVTLTNPNYHNYSPRVLLLKDSRGIEWAGIQRFFSTPPADSDVKAVLETAID
jgi:hypothetical protein